MQPPTSKIAGSSPASTPPLGPTFVQTPPSASADPLSHPSRQASLELNLSQNRFIFRYDTYTRPYAITRVRQDGYQHGVTLREWLRISPLMQRATNEGVGRPVQALREIAGGILWALGSTKAWSTMPRHFAPYQTCHRWYQRLYRTGILEKMMAALRRYRLECREVAQAKGQSPSSTEPSPTPSNLPALLEAFLGFTDTVYFKSLPIYEHRDDVGWRQLRYPATRRQILSHLLDGPAVLGGVGLYRSPWTVLDLDHCSEDGVTLTDEALARYLTVQAALGGAGIPMRSSKSGNLHIWVHHAPLSAALRDRCVARLLAEVSPLLHPAAGVIEVFPQPSSNHRWPFGRGSVLLDPQALAQGRQVPWDEEKLVQIEYLQARPPMGWASLPDELVALGIAPPGLDPPERLAPPSPVGGQPFFERIGQWLAHGPRPGEHNEALGELVLYGFLQGWAPDRIEAWVWEWQSSVGRQCREWQTHGPDACRRHLARTLRRTQRTFRAQAKEAKYLLEYEVPAIDIQTAQAVFPENTHLQQAYFALCRHVRPRLERYYPHGVLPLHMHGRWRRWTRHHVPELQARLERAGLCRPAASPIPHLRSTLFQVTLPPVPPGQPTFRTWEEGAQALGRGEIARYPLTPQSE